MASDLKMKMRSCETMMVARRAGNNPKTMPNAFAEELGGRWQSEHLSGRAESDPQQSIVEEAPKCP